jgi:hypothetical protein
MGVPYRPFQRRFEDFLLIGTAIPGQPNLAPAMRLSYPEETLEELAYPI